MSLPYLNMTSLVFRLIAGGPRGEQRTKTGSIKQEKTHVEETFKIKQEAEKELKRFKTRLWHQDSKSAERGALKSE